MQFTPRSEFCLAELSPLVKYSGSARRTTKPAGTMSPLSTSAVASATKGLDVSFCFVSILIESSQVAGGYYVAHSDSKLRVNTTKGQEGMDVEG